MKALVANSLLSARRLGRLTSMALALLLVGLLPGHGGNSGGVVVLPFAVASAILDRAPLAVHEFEANRDLELRVPAALVGCSVEVSALGEVLETKASLDGDLLTIPYRDLSDLAAVSITDTRFVLAAQNGDTLILDVYFDSGTRKVRLTVR